eukprot:2570803-Lingulodinium_polyedra.AAC.1
MSTSPPVKSALPSPPPATSSAPPGPGAISRGCQGTSPANSSQSAGSSHSNRKAPSMSFLARSTGTPGHTLCQ